MLVVIKVLIFPRDAVKALRVVSDLAAARVEEADAFILMKAGNLKHRKLQGG